MQQLMQDDAGNVWEVDARGNPVRLVTPAGQPPADPTFQYQGPKAEAEARSAQANARVNESTIDAEIRLANARAAEAQANASAALARQSGDGLTEAQKQVDAEFAKTYAEMQAAGGIADIRKQVQQLKDAVEILRESDTITGPMIGRMPQFVQQAVNPDAINVREQVEEVVQRNLRLVLGAQFTQKEGERLISRAFNPALQEGDNIERVERLIQQMDSALDARQSAMAYYEKNGTIAGWTAPAGWRAQQESIAMPEAMQQAHAAWISQNAGNITPDSYARFRSQLDREFGFTPNVEAYRNAAPSINEAAQQGNFNTTIPPVTQDLSGIDQFRNNLAANPVGAAAIGFTDAVGMGGVKALAPEQFEALQGDQALPMALGQIGGAIAGTAGIGALGRAASSRIAPNLLGGGAKSQFARNMATDVAYGAGYGGVSEGDPLTGAALAGAGSAGGQLIGRGLGAAVGGVRMPDAARALQDRGVRMTVGRASGGLGSRVEDLMQSIPGAGDMIRARQLESFQDFNRAAFEDAGAPIGLRPSNIGERGIEELRQGVGGAYDDAVSGVAGPLDAQFAQDMQQAIQAGQRLPADLRQSLGSVLDARVNPINDAGQMTGVDYQQAMRALKATRSRPPQRFEGFEQDYRDAVTGTMDALTGQIERIGGSDVTQGLARANAANRNLKILEDAALDRAKVGAQTGDVNVFLPSQLKAAVRKSEKKYGAPDALKALANQGQEVLPSTVPNSGTTDRALAAGLGLGALGIGGTLDVTGREEGQPMDFDNTAKVAAALALLTAGGSRTGQKVLGDIIYKRPQIAQDVGNALRRRKGLFGTAAVPLALNSGQY